MNASARLAEMLISLACVLGIAFGQILFRIGAQRIDSERLVTSALLNVPLIAALAIYGVATIGWIHVLRTAPLHRVYPIFALGFLIVPLLEWLVLGVPLRWQSLAGGAVIAAGIVLSVSGSLR